MKLLILFSFYLTLQTSKGLIPNRSSSQWICGCSETRSETSMCYDITDHATGACESRPCAPSYTCVHPSVATHYCIERLVESNHVQPISYGICRQIYKNIRVLTPYTKMEDSRKWNILDAHKHNCIQDDLIDWEPKPCYRGPTSRQLSQSVETNSMAMPSFVRSIDQYLCSSY